MKKPIAFTTLLVAATAYTLPHLGGSGAGDQPNKPNQTQQRQQRVLKTVAKAGLINRAMPRAVQAAQEGGNARAANTNELMDSDHGAPGELSSEAKAEAAKLLGAAKTPTQAAPPPKEEPKWRFEGTIVGEHRRPVAIFDVSGSAVMARPGMHLDPHTLVQSIGAGQVSLKFDDGRRAKISPW